MESCAGNRSDHQLGQTSGEPFLERAFSAPVSHRPPQDFVAFVQALPSDRVVLVGVRDEAHSTLVALKGRGLVRTLWLGYGFIMGRTTQVMS